MDILGANPPPPTFPPFIGHIVKKKERFKNFSVTVTMNRLFGDNFEKKT